MASAGLPVNLLCGYLGAGKTTLLNRLLSEGDQRILVMVNDFGDVAVDAALISARSADTIQLSNGCICCSMAGGMFDAFERALAWKGRVDRLVIEASGVAEPARLTAFAEAEPDLDCRAVIVVVDPLTIQSRLGDPRIEGVVRRQVEGADIAYISRRDRLDAGQLDAAAGLLQQINPSILVHAGTEAALIMAMDGPHLDLGQPILPRSVSHVDLFARETILDDVAVSRTEFLDLLRQASSRLHRAKGFVRFAGECAASLVQMAGDEIIISHPPQNPGDGPAVRLVLIGPDARALKRFRHDLVGRATREAPRPAADRAHPGIAGPRVTTAT